MSFKNHFDMLSLHEPVTHKAKFWQSYVRALKGTEDIRADEHQARLRLRPRALSEFPEFFGKSSLLDDRLVSDPNTRIHAPGYRYLPISRETYGYSPRPIYSTYPRPIVTRGSSVPPEPTWRESSPVPVYPRSHYSPVPWDRESTPSPTPSYSYDGIPMYGSRGGYNYRPYSDLYNPPPNLPMSMITRDPWWYDTYGLRPHTLYPRYRYPFYPSALRTSFLSPVKNRYLWVRHPLRYL